MHVSDTMSALKVSKGIYALPSLFFYTSVLIINDLAKHDLTVVSY